MSEDVRVLEVQVTQEDIDKGVPMHACLCPVALALKRLGIEEPYVLHTYTWFIDESVPDHKCKTFGAFSTAEMRQFIYDFDNDYPVKPTTFKLEFRRKYT